MRGAPHKDDDPRVDDAELLEEMHPRMRDICSRGRVVRRTVTNRIREIHGLFVQADRAERPAQPLTRLSDKRPSRFRLSPARCFAHEYDLGIWVTLANHWHTGPMLFAPPTGCDLSCPVLQRGALV
jgi:hypothetical protein